VDDIVDAVQLAHALGFKRAPFGIDQREAQHERELRQTITSSRAVDFSNERANACPTL
jgi:hypothetical protein